MSDLYNALNRFLPAGIGNDNPFVRLGSYTFAGDLSDGSFLSFDSSAFLYTESGDFYIKQAKSEDINVWLSNDSTGDSSVFFKNGDGFSSLQIKSNSTFYFKNSANSITKSDLTQGLTDFKDFAGQGIEPVSLNSTGGIATLITDKPHNLTTGQTANIFGFDQSEYNGDKVITVVDDNTFTFAVSGTPASPATGTGYYQIKGLISNRWHLYKTGYGFWIDYTGEADYPIMTLANAVNTTNRPDLPAGEQGKGDYLRFVDTAGEWFRIQYNRYWLWKSGQALFYSNTTNTANTNPAFHWRCFGENNNYFRMQTLNCFVDVNQFLNGSANGILIESGNTAIGGLKLNASNGDLLLGANGNIDILKPAVSTTTEIINEYILIKVNGVAKKLALIA